MCRIEQDHGINALTTGLLNRAQFDAVTHIINSGNRDAQKLILAGYYVPH